MIIPSIDIINGKAVQLEQGKKLVIEKENIFELAEEFKKYGDIAVIDLDAAMGKGNNLEIIEKLCKIAPCRVGGGIRDIDTAISYLKAGAKKIIVGTNTDKEFLKQIPNEKLIIAIDTKDGKVVNKGWTNSTNKTPFDLIKETEDLCDEYLYTNVNNEGLLKGIDLEVLKKIQSTTRNKITVAGGIKSIEDIQNIEKFNYNSQIGMAIYTGKLNLLETFIAMLKFSNNLIPTIVEDKNNQVLMMAYSNIESITKTFSSEKTTYFSRSRNELWTKGETSGNTQQFVKARYDCDRDTLLYTVNQVGPACHTNRYSCFEDKTFALNDLYDVIVDRKNNPTEKSYTAKIMKDEKEIMKKIKEESDEVINYTDRKNLVWEIGDLTYFLLTLMAKKGITPQEIKNELNARRK